MKQPSYKCSCVKCKKEYSTLGIDTHYMRTHCDDSVKQIWANTNKSKQQLRDNNIKKYNKSPYKCKQCNSILSYDLRHNEFCGHSCSASYTNKQRGPRLESTKQKIGDALRNRIINKTLPKFWGQYSKLYTCKCKYCGVKRVYKKRQGYCNDHQHLKYNKNKDKWSFRFNVYHYPALFDLALLNKVGWCSFGGKKGGKKNLNGLSRDHKVSVCEAKQNNYDPYYISHPCNCELLPMNENNSKHDKSSITYTKLKQLVTNYDKSNTLRGE